MSIGHEIGGYFELELPLHNTLFHNDASAVNSGRNALELILRNCTYNKIYLPDYICDVVIEPVKKLGLRYEYYSLSKELFPKIDNIDENSVLLYVNYFGVSSCHIKTLLEKFSEIIVDNTQAFFDLPVGNEPTFYSPRKFFGVPDGGFAYLPGKKVILQEYAQDYSYNRMSHLLKRIDVSAKAGYKEFKKNDDQLMGQPIMRMSRLTRRILMSVNFQNVMRLRRMNFSHVHEDLKDLNELTSLISRASFTVPLCYPFLYEGNHQLRERFIERRIYVPTYWPHLLDKSYEGSFAQYLAQNILPIPIDQRMSIAQINLLLDTLK